MPNKNRQPVPVTSHGFHRINDDVIDSLDTLLEMSEGDVGAIYGIPTGLADLDKMTQGLQSGDLIVVASRPSMGKSSLATTIASHIAIDGGLPVAMFSLRETRRRLTARFIANVGAVDSLHLSSGKLTDEEWPRLEKAIESVRESPIYINSDPYCTIDAIRVKAQMLKEETGAIGLLVVNYLQLMYGFGYAGGSRSDELGEISRGLKSLAVELKCPVMLLSQLNRNLEMRPDKRPILSDLRDCGAIEDDADVVLFVYCDDYYRDASPQPGIAEVIVAKQRNGPTGTTKFAFIKQISRFQNLEPDISGN